MESMNLNGLANSLQASSLANIEKDLSGNFKDAALTLATFYRSSRRSTKRAYNAGYASACQDLLLMIQQGVSTSSVGGDDGEGGGEGMTIGRMMDWVEARLEAVKAREEEEEEEEERERESQRDKGGKSAQAQLPARATPTAVMKAASASAPPRTKEQGPAPPTPHTPSMHAYPPFPPSSPSPPPSSRIAPSQQHQHPHGLSFMLHRGPKSRTFAKEPITPSFAFDSPGPELMMATPTSTQMLTTTLEPSIAVVEPSSNAPEQQQPVALDAVPISGVKRRHITMSSDSITSDVPTTPASAGTSRRRTRSARGTAGAVFGGVQQLREVQNQNHGMADSMMDVEEDSGRERKRVARR